MKLNEYQDRASETCLPQASNISYLALGLAGEAGEVADKVKKLIRDDKLDLEGVVKELGDVLWYVSNLAAYLGTPLEEVAQINIDKLESRKARGKIQGSGDER